MSVNLEIFEPPLRRSAEAASHKKRTAMSQQTARRKEHKSLVRTSISRSLQFDFYGYFTSLSNKFSYLVLWESLAAAGWCPNQYIMCSVVFGHAATIFCAHYRRPLQRTHKSCSGNECKAYQVRRLAPATKHVDLTCSCEHVTIGKRAVKRIVRNRKIPLVRLRYCSRDHVSVQVVEGTPQHSFVAISHVWSHGLGNAVANSIPACQLRRLQRLVCDLTGKETLFWFDTLCVPRFPQRTRRRAIEGIRDVYKNAEKVLVLDEELQETRIQDHSFMGVVMSLNLSSWMRRLWTLHECVRAHNVHFQFHDGTVDLESLLNHARGLMCSLNANIHLRFVTNQIASVLVCMANVKSDANGARRMVHLWRVLRWRHTAWAEDETICMANMLDIDRAVVDGELLRTPHVLRMRRFLDRFAEYPLSLLFLDVPRLADPGYHWAPRSWLHDAAVVTQQHDFNYSRVHHGIRTEQGFKCEVAVVALRGTINVAAGTCQVTIVVNGATIIVRGFQLRKWLRKNAGSFDFTKHKLIFEPYVELDQLGPEDYCRGALIRYEQSEHDNEPMVRAVHCRLVGSFITPVRLSHVGHQQRDLRQYSFIWGTNDGLSTWYIR